MRREEYEGLGRVGFGDSIGCEEIGSQESGCQESGVGEGIGREEEWV